MTLRIFIIYGVFVALTAWFVLRLVNDQIKPAVRQSTEEALVDTANLLAELVGSEMRNGGLPAAALAEALERYERRQPGARIWGLNKNTVSHRIYITDARGIVLFDSAGEAVGADYSRWNDVYLTLRGEYGARSSPQDPDDADSTVMYVAAPIRDDTGIIGVLTVAKPNSSLQPYIDQAQRQLTVYGAALVLLGIAFAAVLSWRFGRALSLMTGYAAAVSRGERVAPPRPTGTDLRQLADAIEEMRVKLEGKDYVQRYVETLTHELKSPLAAIRGAAELLQDEMPAADRKKFLHNIVSQAERLQDLSERLLGLAIIEQQQAPAALEATSLAAMVAELVAAAQPRFTAGGIAVSVVATTHAIVRAERFMLRQALENLLDNAIRWTPRDGRIDIEIAMRDRALCVTITNSGPHIPDFALPRLTERFYALPDPVNGRKGTGLGLNFVKEVAALHGGRFAIDNVEDGVRARLWLPADSHTIPTQAPS
ncbi:MAG: two-component system sensor histidine kinase CreC [Pseudomonadales bacterium]|nr:two-component system sensor histidine kinase CreC [Pseudomonadales bacterium]